MHERKKFKVLKDFEDELPMGITTIKYSYKQGDEVSLRVKGKVALKWVSMGYVKVLD